MVSTQDRQEAVDVAEQLHVALAVLVVQQVVIDVGHQAVEQEVLRSRAEQVVHLRLEVASAVTATHRLSKVLELAEVGHEGVVLLAVLM